MAERPTMTPHEATLAAHARTSRAGRCCAPIEVEPVSGGEPVRTESVVICMKRTPCPDHPDEPSRLRAFGGTGDA